MEFIHHTKYFLEKTNSSAPRIPPLLLSLLQLLSLSMTPCVIQSGSAVLVVSPPSFLYTASTLLSEQCEKQKCPWFCLNWVSYCYFHHKLKPYHDLNLYEEHYLYPNQKKKDRCNSTIDAIWKIIWIMSWEWDFDEVFYTVIFFLPNINTIPMWSNHIE